MAKKTDYTVRLPSLRAADGNPLDNRQTRAVLIEAVDALTSARSKGHLSMRAAAIAQHLLVQVIDQLPPKRNPRVNLLNYQIAMLAAALIDDCDPGEDSAVLAAIKTVAPERELDEDFRELIGKRCRDVRSGNNRARLHLMRTVHPDILVMARGHLPK